MSYISRKFNPVLFMLFILAIAVLACGGNDTVAPTEVSQVSPTESPAQEPEQPTEVLESPEAAEPTETPAPSNTPEPTATPAPTKTPEPTATPEPTQTPLPFNEVASFADWDYLVTDASISTTIGDEVARGTYIVALVQVTNNGATEREVGSQFFIAKDAQGRTYDMDTDASLEYYQTFGTGAWYLEEIGPSATVIIPVVFDVSPDASGVNLLATGTSSPTSFLVESVGGEPLSLPGEPTSAADWLVVVTGEVNLATSIGDEVARGQYVSILLAVRNDSLTARELGSEHFVIEDGEGRIYSMDTDASLEYYHTFDTDAWYLEAIGPSLVGTIPIVFDVSPDATNLTLKAQQGDVEVGVVLDAVGGEAIQLAGEVYSSGNWEFVVEEVSTATSVDDEIAQGQYLILIIQAKNLALLNQDLGSRPFIVKDAQGRTYEMDTDASLAYHHTFNTDAWHLESIGPSLTGTIPVVFDVATDASGFTLVLQDGTEIPLQ